jgi:cytochrome c oxidase subunit 2|tara:strand:+ start:4262 stop:5098 length:837 start_codon:yes stop_codon:yes gene_type:complete
MDLLSNIVKAFSFPELVSQDGGRVDGFVIAIHLLMLLLFVGWIIYYFAALWKFRASNNPKADYRGVKTKTITNSIEGAVIVAELILVVVATYFWNLYVNKTDDFSDESVVRVTAEQFAWSARYPGADGKLGDQDKTLVSATNPFGLDKSDPDSEDDVEVLKSDIVVPMIKNEDGTHKSVTVDLTSKDVIHCFKVLPLRVCQDVIPGMRIPIHFRPIKVGRYQITCAQLCGDGHARMKGAVKVVDEAEWNEWYKVEKKKKNPAGEKAAAAVTTTGDDNA